jgi:hypothetical protein
MEQEPNPFIGIFYNPAALPGNQFSASIGPVLLGSFATLDEAIFTRDEELRARAAVKAARIEERRLAYLQRHPELAPLTPNYDRPSVVATATIPEFNPRQTFAGRWEEN